MYDIIGDIHGHASALEALLLKMNYKEVNGVWQHPGRRVIFVGDYIDRGPAIRETLHIVRSMTENDKAIALMLSFNTSIFKVISSTGSSAILFTAAVNSFSYTTCMALSISRSQVS